MQIRRLLAALLLPLLPAQPPDSPPIRTATHLVVLNVVATNKRGNPVDDLQRGDFTLRDTGQEQKIAFFAFDDARAVPTAAPTSAPLTFTNRPQSGAPRATAFLFDELNTQLGDLQTAKQEFLRHLKSLPATEHVAVFVLGDSLAQLHDFSDDPAQLVAAISGHRNRAGPEVAASATAPASSNSLTGDSKTTDQWDSFLASSSQPYTNYTEIVRAERTAAALQTIAGHLQGIPGRKTLIWISGGFPIQLGLEASRDNTLQSSANDRDSGRSAGHGRGGAASSGGARKPATNGTKSSTSSNSQTSDLPGTQDSFETEVERAIRALNDADVAVYPVDARGVQVAAPFQANRASFGKRNKPPRGSSPVDSGYETMEALAEQTGGRSFHHINDLNSAIQAAAADSRVTYSLAFYPPEPSLDDSYHRLEVSVDRPGVTLRYRPGYLATRKTAVAPSLADAIVNPVNLTGIGFTAHLDPVEGGYKNVGDHRSAKPHHRGEQRQIHRHAAIPGGSGQSGTTHHRAAQLHRRSLPPHPNPRPDARRQSKDPTRHTRIRRRLPRYPYRPNRNVARNTVGCPHNQKPETRNQKRPTFNRTKIKT